MPTNCGQVSMAGSQAQETSIEGTQLWMILAAMNPDRDIEPRDAPAMGGVYLDAPGSSSNICTSMQGQA